MLCSAKTGSDMSATGVLFDSLIESVSNDAPATEEKGCVDVGLGIAPVLVASRWLRIRSIALIKQHGTVLVVHIKRLDCVRLHSRLAVRISCTDREVGHVVQQHK